MATKHFDQGASVRVYGVFTNSAGTAVDPTTVKLAYRADAIGLTTILTYGSDAALVRGGTGIYYADLDTNDSSGRYEWNLYSTGTGQAAQNGEFYVRRVLTTPAPPSDPMTTLAATNVTFDGECSDTVQRSVRDKLRDFVSILDYGAATTASASANKTAINNALTSASTCGGEVYVPEGTYNVDPGLVIPTGVHLRGAGRLSKFVSSGASVTELVRLNGDHAAISRIWLSGTGQGDGSTISGARGIWIGIGTTTHTDDVADCAFHCRVEDVTVDAFIGNGISGNYQYSFITNSTFLNNTDANIFLQPSCKYNVVANNTTNGSRYSGIDCNGSWNRIANNHCEANGTGGQLDAFARSGILIANISDTNPAVLNIIEGNFLKDNQGCGVFLHGAPGGGLTIPAYGNILKGNIASGHTTVGVGNSPSPTGFAIVGSVDTILEGNLAYANRDNYMVSSSGSLVSTGVQVKNNKSISASRYGYFFTHSPRVDLAGDNPPQRVDIIGNTDRLAGTDSFKFLASTLTFDSYTIRDNRSLSATGYGFNNNATSLLFDYFFENNISANFGTAHETGFTIRALTVNSATPSVLNGRMFQTQNSSTTTYTNFTDGRVGQEIFIYANDANSVFDFTGTNLKGADGMNIQAAVGDHLRAISDGTNWHCTFNHLSTIQHSITQNTSKSTAVTLDWPKGNITMHAASLAASSTVSFDFFNAMMGASDIMHISVTGGPNQGAYAVSAGNNGAGQVLVVLTNVDPASAHADAVVLGYSIEKQ